MPEPLVIIHERLGRWARQLRPRFASGSVRWSETRSTTSLVEAARTSACPILVLDLGDRPLRGLDDLHQARPSTRSGLTLVLDPADRVEVAELARELGATLVLGGVVVPPVVESILRRWIPLAGRRAEREGWTPALVEPSPETWPSPNPFDITFPARRPGPN